MISACQISARNNPEIPKYIVFRSSEETRKHINDLLALLLPWKGIPSRQARWRPNEPCKNYSTHTVAYFANVLDKQINFHSDIKNLDDRAKAYWCDFIGMPGDRRRCFAFYGGGNYCRKLIENWLPDCLLPVAIFDTSKTERFSIGPIQSVTEWNSVVETFSLKIVITSSAIMRKLVRRLRLNFTWKIRIEIVNPFESPKGQLLPKIDNKSILSFFVFHFFDRLDFDGSTPQSRWIFSAVAKSHR